MEAAEVRQFGKSFGGIVHDAARGNAIGVQGARPRREGGYYDRAEANSCFIDRAGIR